MARRPGAAYKPAVRIVTVVCTLYAMYLYSISRKPKVILESAPHRLKNGAGGVFNSAPLSRVVEDSFLGKKRHLLSYTLNSHEDGSGGEGDDSSNCTSPRDPHRGYNSSCSFILDQCGEQAQLFNYLKFILCDLSHIQVRACSQLVHRYEFF